MTDIVKRLRDESLRQQVNGHSGAFYDEPADEIERLREALSNESSLRIEETQRLRAALRLIAHIDYSPSIMRGIARRALRQSETDDPSHRNVTLEGGGEDE